jgi:hypothetical protein
MTTIMTLGVSRRLAAMTACGWLVACGSSGGGDASRSSPDAASGGDTGRGMRDGGQGAHDAASHDDGRGAGDAGAGSGDAGTGFDASSVITPGNPGASDVQLAIDSTANIKPISPYIYGTNDDDLTTYGKNLTLTRVGGNRLTAYNWENNYSNAGSDYLYENDTYLSSSTVAGAPMLSAAQAANTAAASIIMTVPIAGWVASDGSPAVQCPSSPTPAQIAQNFVPILPTKGSAYVYPPDLTDGKVYADEFVHWLESQFPHAQTDPARRIFYMLDNEPDLWSSTHSEIHPAAVTYAELVQKNTAFATGIKAVAPDAIVFGPVDYGWAGYTNLQSAPDAAGRDWLDFYLSSMATAEQSAGKRLVDDLDVHWYPEATGGGTRITDDGTSDAEVAARLQAPRSLWDNTYTETSWIAQTSTNGPIYLIPRLQAKIVANYAGTKVSISEYNYGAGPSISGGLAEADVLGVFGVQGLFAASMWPLSATNNNFIYGGFALYRNYDGSSSTFGDTSISLTNSSIANASAYASVFASHRTNVVVVAINKTAGALKAGITIRHTSALAGADVYVLSSTSTIGTGYAMPTHGAGLTATATNAFLYTMPAYTATTLVFHP